YGPGGVAMLIECLTDNRTRAAMEIRTALTRNNGTLADPSSVSYLFSRKGQVVVATEGGVTEDAVMEATLEAGAEEVIDHGDVIEVICVAGDVVQIRTALQEAVIDYGSAESTFLTSMQVVVDVDGAKK